jgi:glycosyltransferase involved in cell wall biosynthesis
MKLLIYDFELPYLLRDIKHPIGGAAVEALALTKGLIHNDCQVGVLTWKGAKDFIGRETEIDIVETFDKEVGVRKIRWIYYRYPSLIKAIKYYSPDYLLQKCAAIETGIMAHIAKVLNIPFIYRIQNDMEVDCRLNQRLSFFERKMYRYGLSNSQYITAQNEYQYKKIKNKFPNKRICLIHNPFYPLGEIEEKKERKYIAWIGIFSPQKNLPGLLNIVRQMPKNVFKIAGAAPKEGMDKNTKKTISDLAKCKNVQFVGYLKRTEILNFLANAYILLNTSHYEGFSNTFLEAFAAGTPVVSLNSDPNGILKKYKLGFVIDIKNSANFIKGLINDYDHESYKVRMSNYLNKFHDYKVVSKKLIDFLNS